MPFKAPVTEKCPVCQKSVYANESRAAAGLKFHIMCFKCSACNKLLETSNNVEHEGVLFCKLCHGKKYGTKGYGFGGGAGCMATEGTDTNPQKVPGATKVTGGRVEGGCPRCGKRVYEAEKKVGAGGEWHKSCFNCLKCHSTLDSTKCCEREGEIFCKSCYAKEFGPHGKV